MHREKNVNSECDFIGFKNNRLNYRCKECKGIFDSDLNKFALLLR